MGTSRLCATLSSPRCIRLLAVPLRVACLVACQVAMTLLAVPAQPSRRSTNLQIFCRARNTSHPSLAFLGHCNRGMHTIYRCTQVKNAFAQTRTPPTMGHLL